MDLYATLGGLCYISWALVAQKSIMPTGPCPSFLFLLDMSGPMRLLVLGGAGPSSAFSSLSGNLRPD